MKNSFPKIIIFVFSFLAGLCKDLNAQKLPKVQTESLRAPATVKVDGQITEWGHTFKAYNSDNRIWYTMANDDKNLYLVGKFNTDIYTYVKALNGGISLRLYTKTKSNEERVGKSITYPSLNERKEIITDYTSQANSVRIKSSSSTFI